MTSDLPTPYPHLKSQITAARIKAGLAVNKELILLYWNIDREILKRQEEERWDSKIIERISQDLSRSFPEMKGLSPRNLNYILLKNPYNLCL